MKKALFILLMSLLAFKGHSQDIVKYRTYGYTFKETSGDGPYKWAEVKPVSVLVVMSGKRTTVYTSIEQNYDFLGETPSLIETATSLSTSWKAIDQKGLSCTLELLTDKGMTILYIIYNHVQISYVLEKA